MREEKAKKKSEYWTENDTWKRDNLCFNLFLKRAHQILAGIIAIGMTLKRKLAQNKKSSNNYKCFLVCYIVTYEREWVYLHGAKS